VRPEIEEKMAVKLRSGHPGFHNKSARRLTEWAAIVATGSVVVAPDSDVALTALTGADLAPLVPCTLIRIRGEIMVASDQSSADELQLGSLGIGIVQDVARAVGMASTPSPFLDAGDEVWLYWRSLMSRGEKGAGTVIGTMTRNYEIDAKAMRKITDGDSLIVNVSNHNAANGFNVAFQSRFLFLLH